MAKMRTRAAQRVWSTRDIVVGAVLAVAAGLLFWAWDLLYASVFQLIPFPISYLLIGVWMVGGLLVANVIRKPGAAFLGEIVASFVSMVLVNQWGAAVLLSGLVQGIGAEAVFAAGRYRRFSLPMLLAAGAMAGLLSVIFDSFFYSYWAQYTWYAIVFAIGLGTVSGAVLGGLFSRLLADALLRTGVLSGLEISRQRR